MVNIFRLHDDPQIAARHHCDQHVMSGIHEVGQIFAAVLRDQQEWDDQDFFERTTADPKRDWMYGTTHQNHGIVRWTGERRGNWTWAYDYLYALYREKQYRWGGSHDTWSRFCQHLPRRPHWLERGETNQYQAVSDSLKEIEDPVISYRYYYLTEKEFARWDQDRDPPRWWIEEDPRRGLNQ